MSTKVVTPETTAPAGFTPVIDTRHPDDRPYYNGPELWQHRLRVQSWWHEDLGLRFAVGVRHSGDLTLTQLKELHASLGTLIESTEDGLPAQG